MLIGESNSLVTSLSRQNNLTRKYLNESTDMEATRHVQTLHLNGGETPQQMYQEIKTIMHVPAP